MSVLASYEIHSFIFPEVPMCVRLFAHATLSDVSVQNT